MKAYKKIIYSFIIVMLVSSCGNYDELVQNPNLPASVPPALLLTGILEHMNHENAWNGKQGSQSAAQFFISTYDYYGTNNYDQAPFTKSTDNFEYVGTSGNVGTIQNIQQMEVEARKLGLPGVNAYSSLGKFLKAYYYNLMSQKFGDVPLSLALKGSENKTPEYDLQKDVYVQILTWLEDSNSELTQLIAGNTSFGGDIYLGNDLRTWQRVVNAFTLRVLIGLSKKENEAGLNVKERFAAIMNDPVKYPLMTGIEHNLQYTYNDKYNNYPKNPTSQGRDAHRENIGSAFLDLTTSLKDPRTFIAATPAPALIEAGKKFDDYDAYAGAPAGLGMSELGVNAQAGKYSFVNALRYYVDFAGSKAEPAMIIGYPEMCFNIAEGLNRGWAAGDAGGWYTEGIKSSMKFLGLTEGSEIKIGNNLSTVFYGSVKVSIADYLAQPSVQYQGGAAGLTQILNQKYIAFWQNSTWEAFFNQRRTGIPAFSAGPGNGNGDKIAKRWQYPVAEGAANKANYDAAVQRQFAGQDDLNGVLWILK
jgi:hypothetical protein